MTEYDDAYRAGVEAERERRRKAKEIGEPSPLAVPKPAVAAAPPAKDETPVPSKVVYPVFRDTGGSG